MRRLQVKECLKAARVGQPYVAAGGEGSPGSRGADAGGNADGRALQEQQQQQGAKAGLQLGTDGIEGGSDSVSRRLRERTVICNTLCCFAKQSVIRQGTSTAKLDIKRQQQWPVAC
jgi:hypothetical protein